MNTPEATIRVAGTMNGAGGIALPDDSPLPSAPAVIEAVVAGFPIRARLADGSISVTDAQRKAIGASAGEAVTVEITRIGDEPEVRVPVDFWEALGVAKPAGALWAEVTPMARREWVRWIASAKQEGTRARRIEVGIDKLTKGMRRPCCFPGLNWVTKDHVSPEETWAPLPR